MGSPRLMSLCVERGVNTINVLCIPVSIVLVVSTLKLYLNIVYHYLYCVLCAGAEKKRELAMSTADRIFLALYGNCTELPAK